MQTELAAFIRGTARGDEAEAILRKCVHCGFCTATCPTYQLLGDELDGPRGRIYLIKQMLETGEAGQHTKLHLDRCLTCRSCETTCPSGVEYGHLLDVGRAVVDELTPERPLLERVWRGAIANYVSKPQYFRRAVGLARLMRPVLPNSLRDKLVAIPKAGAWPKGRHTRKWLVLGGCAQPALAPGVNAAAARLLDRIGIELIEIRDDGCCGALRFHLDDHDGARRDAGALLARWLPQIERGEIEGVLVTASGCLSFMREYRRLFVGDGAGQIERVLPLLHDTSELVAQYWKEIEALLPASNGKVTRLAFHSPCTLQHGLRIRGKVEQLLIGAGFELTPVSDTHLCCGSAGAYSLLQPTISLQLRDNKVKALEGGDPAGIASANVGCIAHLAGGANKPVRHWVEWLEARVAGAC
jgi:glycolate oxidase iron-sulfur subunit